MSSTPRRWVPNSSANLSASGLWWLTFSRNSFRNPESLNVISFILLLGPALATLLEVVSHLLLCLGFIIVYIKLMSADCYYCCYHLECIEEHINHKWCEFFVYYVNT